jgi:hypothetical protein
LAGLPVVNSVAITQVEAVERAQPPNGILHEPGEPLREYRVQGARIDTAGHGPDDFGTATGAVTSGAISVRATAVL